MKGGTKLKKVTKGKTMKKTFDKNFDSLIFQLTDEKNDNSVIRSDKHINRLPENRNKTLLPLFTKKRKKRNSKRDVDLSNIPDKISQNFRKREFFRWP